MKALSLWQPWASLVIVGAKRFETRGWPMRYTGEMLIHAAKKKDGDVREGLDFYAWLFPKYDLDPAQLPYGSLLGIVTVRGCCKTEAIRDRISEQEYQCGDYEDGRYAIDMANPRMFAEPIPFKGMQGLFEVPADVIQEALHA